MTHIPRHTKVFAGLLAFLFVLATSGFTTILHSCLMEGMSCCENQSIGVETHRSDFGRTIAGSQSILGKATDCCKSTLVGGLNSNPAIFEGSNAHHDAKVVLHHSLLLSLLPAANLQTSSTNLSISPRSGRLFPDAREKYVLTCAFLL